MVELVDTLDSSPSAFMRTGSTPVIATNNQLLTLKGLEMKTIVKLVLVAVLAIGLAGCGSNAFVCQPGSYHTKNIITVDLQLDPAPEILPNAAMIKEKVLFAFDSYKLDAEAESIVEKVAGLMKAHPDTILALKGYTDKYGAEDYNIKLSLNRAEAVYASLVAKGVPADSIKSAEGFGKTQLIPNLTNRENRRVLILSIGGK